MSSLQKLSLSRGFICEAKGCRYKGAPFKSKAGFSNHQRTCKALKEEMECDLKEWKRQMAIEAEAKAREADTLRALEEAPPATSTGGGTGLNANVRS